ncbi:cbb3-type cytochrome oxidase subunit 3 [Orrella marina]|uniref:CcoQ/FixQ family Cbb3-type cytochrome c oxidase assembly chaperone n=1 Tax=Orrella marina TaxID=2163011 RepID=A0A2R4XIC7_9BURK|nr:CcoQ/FixQ family Cbb3-type cytochrome c oxidase assembly chaperone [Orrella marina]AWB33545.1 CcoQ/FixQ family Cbb3-type cytochrome c oxidase assembly chaperone [Orrella marina]
MAILNAIATILAMVLFFGIVWWAFSARRKKDNEQAANLPFDLPDEATQAKQTKDDEVKKP